MFLEQFPSQHKRKGSLEVICGSMFSGKTEELIRRLRRAEFANQAILLFKPTVDHRNTKTSIISHNGVVFKALEIAHAADAKKQWNGEEVVAFDEVQFFDPEIVDVTAWFCDQGVRVIVAGLDMDFTGKSFGSMPELMCRAEFVTKVHAICVRCGNLAYVSHRLVSNPNQVLVGATAEYEALCRTCFLEETTEKIS